MRIEWQVVALSVLVVAGGACVLPGSKTSEDTTEDTVDDGSGGGAPTRRSPWRSATRAT